MAAAVSDVTADVVRWLAFVVVLQTAAVFCHSNRAEPGDSDSHDHHSATNVWTTTRNREFCTSGEERCYSTGQCCPGFVCAASHHAVSGRELIGSCIKVNSLQRRCKETEDCTDCTSEHCQGSSTNVQQKPKLGLGASCGDSSQCHAFTENKVDRLCCQDVHRGRQGTKRMCDRLTPLSVCLVDNAVLF